jgi:hypothetical protein
MQPEQTHNAPVSPVPQVAPQGQAPLTPIAQFDCPYLPTGRYTIFNMRPSVAVIYPGWLVVYQKSDNAEVARIPLGADLNMKYGFGFVRFIQLNGKKYSIFTMNNLFLTAPAGAYIAFVVFILLSGVVSFIDIGKSGTDVGLLFLRLVFLLAALFSLMTGRTKGKALIEACKRAAGIAS